MGQSNSTDLEESQIQKYLRPGIQKQEIQGLLQAFESLQPNNQGLIKVAKLKKLYNESYDKQQLDDGIGEKQVLNFDQFYEVMSTNILDKKQRFGNIEFDSHAKDVPCLLCPYTVQQPQTGKAV